MRAPYNRPLENPRFPSNLQIGGERRRISPPIDALEGNCLLAARLFSRHDASSHTRYQELKQLARSQRRVLAGTPGTLKQRSRRGTDYWVREYIRVDGKKDDEHAGTVSAVDAARIKDLQAEIDLAKALASGSSTLRLFGFQRIERKTAAVLGALFNRGLYQAGVVLVGSHAYGALLNELGIVAPGYRTQDVDVARAQPLAVALPAGMDFQQLLNESALEFVAVPGMPSKQPSGSFKLRGADALAVDLLVPGKTVGKVVPIEELGAHAQSIPLLDFLAKEPLDAVVLSPNQVVPVKVPSPERFVLHKLFSSQSRKTDRDKIRKDLQQAAVLAAAVEEETPGRIADLIRTMPSAGRAAARRGARAAARLIEDAHPLAREALQRIAGR